MVDLEDCLTALVSLSHFQIIYVNLKTTSTVLISHASKFEIWRPGQCFLRLPNLVCQVGLSIAVATWQLEQKVFHAWVFVCHCVLCTDSGGLLPVASWSLPVGLLAWSCAERLMFVEYLLCAGHCVPHLSVYISSCNPHTSVRGYYPYFTDKETEAQNFQVTFLRSSALWSYHVAST